MNILDVQGLQKTYVGRFGKNKTEVLKNVNFTVEKGEYVAVMGESGSGKTTLLNIIAGIDSPTAGKVLIDGKEFSKSNESQAAAYRRDNLQNQADLQLQGGRVMYILFEPKRHKHEENTKDTRNFAYFSSKQRTKSSGAKRLLNLPSIRRSTA